MAAAMGVETDLITLTRHLLASEHKYKGSGDLTMLMSSIILGIKFVSMSVKKAGIAKLTGLAGVENVQGEEVKKLDVIANEVFVNALISSGKCSLLVSEELDNAILIEEGMRGPYIVCFDPLDGSSNIDAGVSIGTIFGIYRVNNCDGVPTVAEALRKGSEMVMAGYAMYGSSTQLVISHGHGVDGYTLDPSLGEFILTHEQIRIPESGKIYSVNEGNSIYWDSPTTQFVKEAKQRDRAKGPKSLRYIGSMVADVHRTLLYGGIFMYPADSKSKKGKLRVLYECFPMAFLTEQAGGRASTGMMPMLDLEPTNIHERSPIFLGSKNDVERVEELYSLNGIN